MSVASGPTSDRVLFDATLHPHRSLGPRGVRIVIGFAAVWLLGTGTAFVLVGAWPVMGFCGLELLLLYVAFRVVQWRGRAYERLRLTDSAGLEIRRFGPHGGETGHWRFEPGWLRVAMDDPPRHDSALTLTSHGRSLTVGRFLTPAERLEVAAALRSALARYRAAPDAAAPT